MYKRFQKNLKLRSCICQYPSDCIRCLLMLLFLNDYISFFINDFTFQRAFRITSFLDMEIMKCEIFCLNRCLLMLLFLIHDLEFATPNHMCLYLYVVLCTSILHTLIHTHIHWLEVIHDTQSA